MKQVTICVDQDEIQLNLGLLVDPEIFTEELAEKINTFWSGHEERLEESGNHRVAALKLIAATGGKNIYSANNLSKLLVVKPFS